MELETQYYHNILQSFVINDIKGTFKKHSKFKQALYKFNGLF